MKKTKNGITISAEDVSPPIRIEMSGKLAAKLLTELTDLDFNDTKQPSLWNFWDLLDDVLGHE